MRAPLGIEEIQDASIFFNHGQCCCAGSRLLIERDVFDEVVNGVAKHAKKIKIGPGLSPDTEMGPLVSEEQLSRVTNYMNQGKQDGSRDQQQLAIARV